jgi:general secretion pathway protein F
VAVVGAGEQSGHLGLVLERLADDLEERQALQRQADRRHAVPGHRHAGGDRDRAASHDLRGAAGGQRVRRHQARAALPHHGDAGPERLRAQLGLVLLVRWPAGLRHAARGAAQPAFRERFDAGWLKLPLVGKLARGYNAARFAGTLAMLAGAGVPILRALQAAAETLGNRAMRADALDALVLVREGAPLASALAQKKRFPGLLAMFARLGEQTGTAAADAAARGQPAVGAEVQRRALHLATSWSRC